MNMSLNISIAATLFPAIPLVIVAFNFRYTSLASLMRSIAQHIENVDDHSQALAILINELKVLRKRMEVIKMALFLAGVSFILNTMVLLAGQYDEVILGSYPQVLSLFTLIVSMGCFCYETFLSTKALNLHISRITLPHARAFFSK